MRHLQCESIDHLRTTLSIALHLPSCQIPPLAQHTSYFVFFLGCFCRSSTLWCCAFLLKNLFDIFFSFFSVDIFTVLVLLSLSCHCSALTTEVSWGLGGRGRRCTLCIDHSNWLEKICLIGFQISLLKKTTPKKIPLIIVCGRGQKESERRNQRGEE